MTKPGRMALCALLAALLVAGFRTAAPAAEAIGEVVSMAGAVTAQQPGGAVRKLDLKQPVEAGDVIATGARSNVEIVFRDQSVFSQGPDSSTALDEYVYSNTPSASKMLLRVGAGTFRYVTGQIVRQNPAGFALTTPTTTIGIRGTEVFAETTAQGEEIGVLSMTAGHVVDVSTASARRTITRAGYSVKATPDGRLSEPAPTAPATRIRVMRAAPQTSQGESGGRPGDSSDLERKVEAFAAAVDRTKSDLGTVTDHPDYNALHTINLQTSAEQSAENDRDNPTAGAGLGSDGGDGGGGGGY